MERVAKVSLEEVLARIGSLSVADAVAVVLAVGDRTGWTMAPSGPGQIVLSADGSVDLRLTEEAPPAGAAAFAELLQALLPEAGSGAAGHAGGVRLAVARALRLIDLPPFPSGAAFGANLRRFAAEPPETVLAALVARCSPRTIAGPWPPRPDSRTMVETPAEEPLRDRRLNAPRTDVLRQLLHEADLQMLALLESERAAVVMPPRPAERDLTLVRGNSVTPRTPETVPAPPARAHRSRGLYAAAMGLAIVMSFAGSYFAVRHLHDEAAVLWMRAAATFERRGADAAADVPTTGAAEGAADARGDALARGSDGSAPEAHAPASGDGATPGDVAATAGSAPPPGAATALAPAVERAAAQPLPFDGGRTYSPSFAPEGDSLYFHSEDAAGSRLMRARLGEGGAIAEVSTLLDDGARNFHPRVSPDGGTIAFDSDRDGERAVYVARRDGSGARRVSSPGYAAVPTWAPDGRTLAIIRAEPGRPRVWNLWSVNIDTGEERRLTRHASGQAWPGAWFADGRLAYTHEDQLHVLDTRTGARQTFDSPRRGRLVRTATVSPDGRQVAFQVHRDGMWMLNLEDLSMRRVLDDPTAEEFAWAPTGTHLAYHSRRAGRWGVWVVPVP